MSKTIIVKGFIQSSLYGLRHSFELTSHDFGVGEANYLTHRPVEIEVPIHSLKFDPNNEVQVHQVWDAHTLDCLIEAKRKTQIKLAGIEEQIQSMLALPNLQD